MSNAYNDWKKDMESYTKFFKRGDKAFKGICYNNDYCTDGMNYEFCDLLLEDVVIHKQFQNSGNAQLLIANEKGELISMEQMIDNMKVLIVQVGTSSRNPDGTYDEHYEKTLYVFHNDWLMSDGKDLFVVDEHYIKEWTEITEQEFVKINKKEG
jgi:hypothetical protein